MPFPQVASGLIASPADGSTTFVVDAGLLPPLVDLVAVAAVVDEGGPGSVSMQYEEPTVSLEQLFMDGLL